MLLANSCQLHRQKGLYMENYISVSHWGMFKNVPKHEPEVEERRKRFEKILFPVVEQIVKVKVDV